MRFEDTHTWSEEAGSKCKRCGVEKGSLAARTKTCAEQRHENILQSAVTTLHDEWLAEQKPPQSHTPCE